MEQIIQECIITTVRESIPTEEIIRAYMDETIEQEEEVTIEDVKKEDLEPKLVEPEENIKMETKEEEPEEKPVVPTISNVDNDPVVTKLTFNNYDSVQEDNGSVSNIEAPKNVERLEEIANSRAIQRRLEEEEDDYMDEKIKIHTDNLDLSSLDIFDIDKPNSGGELSLGDIEVLA